MIFLNWFFNRGKSFNEVIDEKRAYNLFNGIKKMSEKSKQRISIFLFSDEALPTCLDILNEIQSNLSKFGINNVIVEGMTGEHGRFMIDRNRKVLKMYEMPKETFDELHSYHTNIWPDMEKYLHKDSKSYLHYTLPIDEKRKETLKDYLVAFSRTNGTKREKIIYLPFGDSKTDMIVLAKEQFPSNVKRKVLEYYQSKYFFRKNEDIINSVAERELEEKGDEQK